MISARGIRAALSVALLVVLAVLFARYVVSHQDRFRILPELDPQGLVILVLLNLGFIGVAGYLLKILTAHYGVKLGIDEWYGLSAASTFVNHLVPFRGGAGLRAVYLKQIHRLAYSRFVSTLGATYVLNFLVNSLLGIAGILYLRQRGVTADRWLLLSAVAVAGGCLFVLVVSPRKLSGSWSRWRPLQPVIESWRAWESLRGAPRVLGASLLTAFVSVAVFVVRLHIAFGIAGSPVDLTQAVVIACFSLLASLLSLTPGSLGVREGVILFASRGVGIDPADALVAAAVDRAVALVCVFTVGPLFSYVLGRRVV